MTPLFPANAIPGSNDDLPSEIRCPQRLYSLMGAERCLSWQSEAGCGTACSVKASPVVVRLARSGPPPVPRRRGEGYLGQSNDQVFILTRLRKLLDEGLEAEVMRERLGLTDGELNGLIDRLSGSAAVRLKRRGWRHPVQLVIRIVLRGLLASPSVAHSVRRHRRVARQGPVQLPFSLILDGQQHHARHA